MRFLLLAALLVVVSVLACLGLAVLFLNMLLILGGGNAITP